MINKEKFDRLFLRYFWKIIVMLGYLIVILMMVIFNNFLYEIKLLEFTFFTVFYVACTWQVFIERGD